MRNTILDTLNQAMGENLDKFFPEMKFTRNNKGIWVSPLGLKGRTPQHPNREKSFSNPGSGYFSIYEQGNTPISYIDYKLELMGYSKGDKGEGFRTALTELCKTANIPIDKDNLYFAEAQRERERQQSIEDVCNKMRDALLASEEAEPIRKYLKQERGYGVEKDIDGKDINLSFSMGLGYINTQLCAELRESMGSLWNDNINGLGIGTTYRLAIPCRFKGKIVGFNFRKTDNSKKGFSKYVNSFKTGEKGKYLFGLTPLSVKDSKYKDLIITEGELDCAHASVLGLRNVVAMGGSSVPVKALEAAKNMGFEDVTLLLDTEEELSDKAKNEEQNRTTDRKIRAFLEIAKDADLCAFVARLPQEKGGTGLGKKVDVDSYLLTHSVSDLKAIIDAAPTGAKYLYNQTIDQAIAENRFEDKDLKLLKSKVIDLILWADDPEDKNYIKASFAKDLILDNGFNLITEEDISRRVDILQSKRDQEAKRNKLKRLLEDAAALSERGEDNTAIDYIGSSIKSINEIGQREKFSSLIHDNIDSIFADYKEEPKIIKTLFMLGVGTDSYQFALPSGALTVIAAPTNHGKSKFLQSLALDIAERKEGGTVLYITFEENKKNVIKQLINAYADIEITKQTARHGNIQTITDYLYDGSTKFMRAETVTEFKQKVALFKELYRSQAIKVVKPEDNYLSTLCNLLKYACRELDIKAIFIDYVQELYIENNKNPRADELKEIMVKIDLIAQENDIPIVLAAQLKRDTESPISMSNQDISDSGWIERKASEILLLWSNKEICKGDADGKKTAKANSEILGLNLGTRGRIYAKLTKSRLSNTGVDAVLEINGNTGRVRGNIKQEEAKEQDLPFDSSSNRIPDTF